MNFCDSGLYGTILASKHSVRIMLLTILQVESQAGGGEEQEKLGGEILNFISSAKDDRFKSTGLSLDLSAQADRNRFFDQIVNSYSTVGVA